MTFETGTALSVLVYVVIASGFIFRMESRIRSISDRIEKIEKYNSRYLDTLIPTLHKLDGKIDTLFHFFSDNFKSKGD